MPGVCDKLVMKASFRNSAMSDPFWVTNEASLTFRMMSPKYFANE